MISKENNATVNVAHLEQIHWDRIAPLEAPKRSPPLWCELRIYVMKLLL